MSQDPFRRIYKFSVEMNGVEMLECDKVSGIEFAREIIEHADAQGDKIPLAGPKGIQHIEFHNWDNVIGDFWTWFTKMDPERKSGLIHGRYQDDTIALTIMFKNAIPESGNIDDLDRETAKEAGAGLKVACNIIKVTPTR